MGELREVRGLQGGGGHGGVGRLTSATISRCNTHSQSVAPAKLGGATMCIASKPGITNVGDRTFTNHKVVQTPKGYEPSEGRACFYSGEVCSFVFPVTIARPKGCRRSAGRTTFSSTSLSSVHEQGHTRGGMSCDAGGTVHLRGSGEGDTLQLTTHPTGGG